MSGDADRIAVPTNGRRPHAVTIEPAAAPTEADRPMQADAPGEPTVVADLSGAMSPRQMVLGVAILASLAALLAGRVLRRRPGR